MDVVLTALAVPNIRVDLVTTSEQTISVLIAEVDVESAVQALQQSFIGLKLVTDEMRC
jgi:aspartokinase